MKAVTLYDLQGKFVTEIQIPAHVTPDVIHWESRFFVWRNAEQKFMETKAITEFVNA